MLTAALLCVVIFAAAANAQKVDRWWEATQKRNPWMYQIDNTDEKTWAVHTAVTFAGAGALWALTPMSFHTAGHVMVGFYFARELLNRTHWRGVRPVKFDYRHKPLDGFMDFAMPWLGFEVVVRW